MKSVDVLEHLSLPLDVELPKHVKHLLSGIVLSMRQVPNSAC